MTKIEIDTRIREGRANRVVERFDPELGHWVHVSDILPGDGRWTPQ